MRCRTSFIPAWHELPLVMFPAWHEPPLFTSNKSIHVAPWYAYARTSRYNRKTRRTAARARPSRRGDGDTFRTLPVRRSMCVFSHSTPLVSGICSINVSESITSYTHEHQHRIRAAPARCGAAGAALRRR